MPEILIVEDSPVEAELLRRCLDRAGFPVTVTKNGEAGLQAARARRPALVVSDIRMPLMDGHELCRAIKYDEALWNLPVILLTMLSEPEDIMQAINSGADSYITKPFVEASLLERIRALLAMPIRRKRAEERRSERVEYNGKPYTVTGGSQQILNLLLSVYENTLGQNRDLIRIQAQLNLLNEDLERVNESLRLQWEIARNMAEAVYLIRASDGGVIVETNPKFDAMFGYAPGELLGQPVSVVNAPAQKDPAATAREIMAALNATGEWHGEVENIRKDGSRFWCSANVSTFDHPKFGKVWISVHNDISQRKAAERMKNEIIGMVSHELRTPLSSLRGFAELMLAREFPPQKQREFLTIIDQESRRLGRLIDEFLDIQRIESGRQTYHLEALALLPLLQDAVALFSRTNERHRFRVEAGLALPAVHGDREKLTQVLENLLSNAVKFSPAGGDISVAARVRDGEMEVRVTDHGIGIPPEALPQLFQKFYRVEQPKALRQPGTGLGLALVKEIVEAHGGQVGVDSEPGQGSTFYFTLPVASQEP